MIGKPVRSTSIATLRQAQPLRHLDDLRERSPRLECQGRRAATVAISHAVLLPLAGRQRGVTPCCRLLSFLPDIR